MTESLPLSGVLVTVNQRRRTGMLESTVTGLCAELNRLRPERDELRGAVERALHDLRNGWHAAALDVLERAIEEREP